MKWPLRVTYDITMSQPNGTKWVDIFRFEHFKNFSKKCLTWFFSKQIVYEIGFADKNGMSIFLVVLDLNAF